MIDTSEPLPDCSTPRPGRLSPWTAVLVVVGMRVALGMLLAVWELLVPTPQREEPVYYHDTTPRPSLMGQLFVKWDSYWYLNIAEYGYQVPREDQPQSNLAFAPLYPALLYVTTLVGIEAWHGGALISLLCYLLLLYYLYQLGCALRSARLGCLLMIFVSAFPSAWVLQMVYTESMFGLFLAAFFTHYLRGQYVRAGLFALLLPLVRVAGVAVVPAVIADVGYRWFRERRSDRRWVTLLPAGMGVVLLGLIYFEVAGSPLAFSEAPRAWFGPGGVQGQLLPLVAAFLRQWTRTPAAALVLLFFAAYAITSVLVLRRDKDISGWFAVIYMLMLLKTPVMSSQLRFLLVLFPAHVYWVKYFEEKGAFKAAVVILLLAQLVLTRLYLSWRVCI